MTRLKIAGRLVQLAAVLLEGVSIRKFDPGQIAALGIELGWPEKMEAQRTGIDDKPTGEPCQIKVSELLKQAADFGVRQRLGTNQLQVGNYVISPDPAWAMMFNFIAKWDN